MQRALDSTQRRVHTCILLHPIPINTSDRASEASVLHTCTYVRAHAHVITKQTERANEAAARQSIDIPSSSIRFPRVVVGHACIHGERLEQLVVTSRHCATPIYTETKMVSCMHELFHPVMTHVSLLCVCVCISSPYIYAWQPAVVDLSSHQQCLAPWIIGHKYIAVLACMHVHRSYGSFPLFFFLRGCGNIEFWATCVKVSALAQPI